MHKLRGSITHLAKNLPSSKRGSLWEKFFTLNKFWMIANCVIIIQMLVVHYLTWFICVFIPFYCCMTVHKDLHWYIS
jgi:hypothetical protein